ncbi:MAG: arylsulfotransferase family protein [Phycisphaerae bacterium]
MIVGCGLLLSLGACQKESDPPEKAAETSDDAVSQEINRLRSLGYASGSSEPAQPGEIGLTQLDEARWCPGYTLFNSRNHCLAELVDLDGEVAHAWRQTDGRTWDDCELLPNGDLLVVGSDRVTTADAPVQDAARFIMRLSWDSQVLWKQLIFAHHDVEAWPDGRCLVVTHKYQRLPEYEDGGEAVVDYLTLLTADGRIETERSLYQAFKSNPGVQTFQPVGAVASGPPRRWDPLHTNSAERTPWENLCGRNPLYAANHVLVCVRHQDTVAIIDWDTGKMLWAWGPGEVQGPHDAHLLESGNILLFDNGLWRKWSRVIELDPRTRQIVWEYRAADPKSFYTHSGGGCQRLPNGNTLITHSDNGYAFEVTPAGDVVWEYHNPRVTMKGKRLSITRMHRYTPAYVTTILNAH